MTSKRRYFEVGTTSKQHSSIKELVVEKLWIAELKIANRETSL